MQQQRRRLPASAIINLGIISIGLVLVVIVVLAPRDRTAAAGPIELAVALEPVAGGLDGLVLLTGPGDGSGDRYIVEQRGRVLRLRADGSVDPEPLLDITDRVLDLRERGLLGLAFHPGFADDGRFFVAYSRRDDGATSISEFTLAREGEPPVEGAVASQPRPIEATERPLLVLPQPHDTHKGGMLAFDRDGMLLVSTGDGGSANDPDGNGLDRASLLGKLLRLDVDEGRPYGIPRDNGFSGDPRARPEIHAIGLRNPWRFSVDRESGDIYIGDVGQGQWEEIDVLLRGTREASFGWSDMEGRECFYGRPCDPDDHILPAIAYPHVDGDSGHCAVIGGYAYRGDSGSLPEGTYLYADYCSGTIWGVPAEQLTGGTPTPALVGRLDPAFGQAQGFGQDDAGELYLVTSSGYVLHISEAAGVA